MTLSFLKTLPQKSALQASLLVTLTLMVLIASAGSHADSGSRQHAEEHADEHAEHVSELDGMRAVHGWTNATHSGVAHVYVELENTTDKTFTLTGAHADVADEAMLAGFRLVNGEPRHEPIEAMPLDPSSTLVLSPNGLSILLDGLSGPLIEGEHFELYLETDAGTLDVHVAVESVNARQHGHAGHAH